ncbi:MAG: pyridoxal-phosphate dependent enzyme, partial [Thermoplasmata archaeon]
YSGMKHLLDSGEINKVPTLIGVQAKAISPLCSAINGENYDPENRETTIADALVSKKPVLIDRMIQILKETGKCVSVTDDEIVSARNDLALKGVFCEYSSATVYAAYKKKKYENSLLIITGNGLKN